MILDVYNDGLVHDFLHSVTYLYGVNVKGNNNDRQNVSALFVEMCLSLFLSRGFSFAVTLFHVTHIPFLNDPDGTNEIIRFITSTLKLNYNMGSPIIIP